MKTIAVVTLVFAVAVSGLGAGEFGININGLSYHYKRKTFTDNSGRERELNNVNAGLGVQYVALETGQVMWLFEAGFYRDSLYNIAKFASYEYKFKINDSLSLGGGLVLLDTPSYLTNVGILPIVSYRVRGIPWIRDLAFNLTWLPDVPNLGTDEDKSALALYLTLYPFRKNTPLNQAGGQ